MNTLHYYCPISIHSSTLTYSRNLPALSPSGFGKCLKQTVPQEVTNNKGSECEQPENNLQSLRFDTCLLTGNQANTLAIRIVFWSRA